jgi:hypothetical protein
LGHTHGIDCNAFTSKVSTAFSSAVGFIFAIPKAVFGHTHEILSKFVKAVFCINVSNAK